MKQHIIVVSHGGIDHLVYNYYFSHRILQLEQTDVNLIRRALYEQLQPAITMLSLLRGTNVLTLIIDIMLDERDI